VLSLGLLPLAAVAAFVIASVSNADPGPKSKPLHGRMENIIQHFGCQQSPIGVCSTFEAKGEIKGDGFVVVDTIPDQSNFGFSKAHTVITTRKGDELHCHEAALFSAPGADLISSFVDLCLIDGGTGMYDGATGYIQEVGTFDFGATPPVGNLDYYGQITLQHDH